MTVVVTIWHSGRARRYVFHDQELALDFACRHVEDLIAYVPARAAA